MFNIIYTYISSKLCQQIGSNFLASLIININVNVIYTIYIYIICKYILYGNVHIIYAIPKRGCKRSVGTKKLTKSELYI